MKHPRHIYARVGLGIAAIAMVVGLGACGDQPSVYSEALTTVDLQLTESEQSESQVDKFVRDIEGADTRILAAVSHLQNERVANALVEAQSDGVEVKIVSDANHADETGFQILEENDIDPVYGDGALSYLPDPNLSPVLAGCRLNEQKRYSVCTSLADDDDARTMDRPGSFNLMSHNFALIDKQTVWMFALGFDGAAHDWLGWRGESESMFEDLQREFRQLHGGVFSIDLDVYSGENKVVPDGVETYHTDVGDVGIHYNPQERLVKRVIDAVYEAKSSVFIMTDNLRNPFLLEALEYKKAAGFDVRVVVHPDHQIDAKMDRLRDLGVRLAPEGLDHLPTLAITDAEPADDGAVWPRKAQIVSHPLWRARPFKVEPPPQNCNPRNPNHPPGCNDRVLVYPADLFVDGTMWTFRENLGEAQQDRYIQKLEDYWIETWKESRQP